jgi:N-acetylglucosamine kinase-like BadF-type ATPase
LKKLSSKKAGKTIIGIDAGATSSESVLYSTDKKENKTKYFHFPPINYNLLGVKKTVDTLCDIIDKTRCGNSLAKIGFIAAGIAGARHDLDRIRIKNLLTERLDYNNIAIFPDTEIAHASVFEPDETNCGILISGTGSVLYYKDNERKTIRIGGWGRYLGDEGSGYWIAKEALADATKHYDGRGRQTLLASEIHKRFDITADTILQKVYHDDFEISKITGTVFDCAENGDIISADIIMKAAEHLADHFIPLKNLRSTIALCGSLFSEEKLLEQYLTEIVKEKYPQIELFIPKQRPVMGAVNIAKRILKL